VVAVELGRLLRRGLLVAATAAAGWLLSVLFAGAASADTLPDQQPHTQEQPSGGLLGGLLGGVTHTVTGLTETVVGITGSVADATTTLLTPPSTPDHEPVVDVPVLLPGDGWGSGTTETDRVDVAPVQAPKPAPKPAAPAPRAVTPAPVKAAPQATPKLAAAPVPAPRAAVAEEHDPAGDRAGTGTDPEPVKTPAGPATPGTSVSAAHDHSGNARTTHGVLVSHAVHTHPADAGFTTRSRAVSTAGRDVGLPASTPD